MAERPLATTERQPATPAPKPLRADAQRNRDKLVEVAAQAFATDGVDASLEEIARQAEVGIGTLYRHFPTREHLVEIVYRREVEALCLAAEELARDHPADVALELWMQRFVDYIATKRGLATSLRLLLNTNSTLFSDTS
ncbi:TetR/AcrR family transcriptional regulator, partial [Mesorhizobium sp. M4B.F.Ca.ET.017.02.2.1]|uniref:TetR/AcrR family transcriptional regulator n=1 Tax=Mesorhizobium sp. M4B.F.Ca.ET.017.02.2.1 TaxID=2496649 RepID=UPI000FD2D172